MRKGKLVGLKTLPQLTLLDDNGKIKVVELQALVLDRWEGFTGELELYHTLKAQLNQPVEYLPSKSSQHRCKLVDANGTDIGLGLVAAGLATIDEEQLAKSLLYSPEEMEKLKQAQQKAKDQPLISITNCVRSNELLADLANFVAVSGEFTIESIRGQVIVSSGSTYLPVTLTHLNLSLDGIEQKELEEFIRSFQTVTLNLSRPVFVLAAQSYIVQAVPPLALQEELLRRGWADLSTTAEIELEDPTYQILHSARQQAIKTFRGLWSNPVDIFQSAYTKDNFLAIPVQVDEGNVFLMKNIETGQYQSVEVYGVVCPQNDEVGAYEAREFSRKEALGQEFNVYVRKDLGFRQMASLVRLSDSQRYSKLLVSNGWATVRDEKETNVDPQFSRLLELQRKCLSERIGLFSSKLGKVRFEDLTKTPSHELREHLRSLYNRLTNSLHQERKLVPAVVIGSKKNNVLSLLLKEYRFIVNVQLEGVSVLDFKLVLKEYTDFKTESVSFLRDHIVQRDVELEVVDLREAGCQLVGYVYIAGRDICETLLENGLVYCSGSFSELENRQYSRLQEQAKQQQKGMWTPVLSRLKSSREGNPPQNPFRATISEVVDGSTVYYQTAESLERLERQVSPLLENGLEERLHKQHIKVGNLCAAPFEDGKLYRARILSRTYPHNIERKKGNKIFLIYVDYGNRLAIDQDQLRQLPEQLMKVEELAQKTRLFLVKKLNVNNESKLACKEEIENIILNKEFTAVPVTDEAVMLYDCKEGQQPPEDIFQSINIELISEGLAKPDPDDLQLLPEEQQQYTRDLVTVARNDKTHPRVWLQNSDEEDIKKQLGDL